MQFLFHLSNRGFTGKLAFDHDKMKLNLRVQTDDLEGGSTQNRQKDAKSLSGGEKSFSTICLLLTMWESGACPSFLVRGCRFGTEADALLVCMQLVAPFGAWTSL